MILESSNRPLSSLNYSEVRERDFTNYSYACTEDIGYYDYRPVTLLFACFISFQRYALS